MKVYHLVFRYLLLILLGLKDLFIFYIIFTPLTVYPVLFILSLFYTVSLNNTTIFINFFPIHLVEACIAGSAYYLLIILNLATPMPIKKRVLSIIFSISLLWIINIFRILVFSVLFMNFFSLANFLHMLTWYFLSAVLVFLIWYITIKVFKIKDIPVYTDLKNIFRKLK